MKDSEAEELRRFQKMQVYDHEGRQRAMLDDNRIFVKVDVGTSKGRNTRTPKHKVQTFLLKDWDMEPEWTSCTHTKLELHQVGHDPRGRAG